MRAELRRALGRARRVQQRLRGSGASGERADDVAPPRFRSRRADRDVIIRSGFFDQEWVEIQLGRRFDSLEEAVDGYLTSPGDFSPHPLFHRQWFLRKWSREDHHDPLVWYLTNSYAWNHAPHPLVDVAKIVEDFPEYADAEFGPVTELIRSISPDTPLPVGNGMPSATPAQVRDWAFRDLQAWRARNELRRAPRILPGPPDGLVDAAPAETPAAGDGPLVTVVMPLWNRAGVVRRAIESVQAQSFTDWELIVVDDGSEDDSAAVVAGIAAFDPRIVPLKESHLGVSGARNAALEQARGRYVAFLDSDNAWRPDFLAVMTERLETHGWEMAHAVLRIHRGGEILYRALEGSRDHLLVSNHVDLNVLVARTDLVRAAGGFDVTLRRGVDYDLILKLAARADLHLVPYVGVEYDDTDDATDNRISSTESLEWLSVIGSRHLVDWTDVAARDRTPGLTSIVMPVNPILRRTFEALRQLATSDREVLLVDAPLGRPKYLIASAVARAFGNVTLVPFDFSPASPVTAANVGFGAATGERVVISLGQADLTPEAIDGIVAPLDDAGVAVVQPVLQHRTGVVASAGGIFPTTALRPQAFLAGHHLRDAEGLGTLDLPAALGDVLAVRAADLAAVGGLDPLGDVSLAAMELSIRLRDAGRTVLCGDVVVERSDFVLDDDTLRATLPALEARLGAAPSGSAACWQRAGLEPVAVLNRPPAPPEDRASLSPNDRPFLLPQVLLMPPRAVVSEGLPRLRWTVDLASPGGSTGETWGDTHFGRALARSLERLGQHVCVDHRGLRHRSSRDLDDVILVLRGLDLVEPRPGCLNLEWIISHPDLVTPGEIAGFDRVYAASTTWPDLVKERWGLAVHPMLQATDTDLFHPGRAAFDTGSEVLFVGNTRNQFRPAVQHAIAIGAPLDLHGSGWDAYLGEDRFTSEGIPNTELGEWYAAAGVVLNDHWEDMRLMGFVSNRLMDAAASGARIASDAIPGTDLTELFHGLVQTWDGPEDLRRILKERDTVFPSADERRRAAEQVAAEHSFDARARVLLEDATTLLREHPHRVV